MQSKNLDVDTVTVINHFAVQLVLIQGLKLTPANQPDEGVKYTMAGNAYQLTSQFGRL